MTTTTMDNPNVLIRPPRLFIGFMVSGLMLDMGYPLTIIQTPTFWLAGAGIALILISAWLVKLSMETFHQAQTKEGKGSGFDLAVEYLANLAGPNIFSSYR